MLNLPMTSIDEQSFEFIIAAKLMPSSSADRQTTSFAASTLVSLFSLRMRFYRAVI